MTPQQIDAMKLALEALKTSMYPQQKQLQAITAIKETLAEHAMCEVQRLGQEIEPKIGCVNHDCDQCKAEQEPVAKYSDIVSDGGLDPRNKFDIPPQRTWVGLTDEEIKTTLSQLYCDLNQIKLAPNDRPQKETVGFLFARAIEAKLKEKNK